jgi:hypothetical protein
MLRRRNTLFCHNIDRLCGEISLLESPCLINNHDTYSQARSGHLSSYLELYGPTSRASDAEGGGPASMLAAERAYTVAVPTHQVLQ